MKPSSAMRPWHRRCLAFLFCGLTLGGSACGALAGQIKVQIVAQCWAWEDRLEISLEVANQGQEELLNLQARVLGLAGAKPSQLIKSLPPDKSAPIEMVTPLPSGPPGRYALPLRLDLQDTAQIPYSAMAHTSYFVGADRSNPLVVKPEPLQMADRGLLEIAIVNTEERAISLDWRVYAPRELQVDSTQRRVEIPARSSQRLILEVGNLTGQGMAEYPLLVWTGYELDGARLEKIVEARAELIRPPGFFQRNLLWWFLLGGLLAVWVAWAQLRSRPKT